MDKDTALFSLFFGVVGGLFGGAGILAIGGAIKGVSMKFGIFMLIVGVLAVYFAIQSLFDSVAIQFTDTQERPQKKNKQKKPVKSKRINIII